MIMSDVKLLNMYRIMKIIRYFEETILDLYQRNIVRGAAHLSIGQEAIAAGVCEVLNNEDHILTTHRGHGHCLAKGADPKYMFAELLGRYEGYCKGKGGSMHISDYSSGILCANGIVGGGLPISVGAGLAKKLNQKDSIIVCFFGDGAVGQGAFHESLNLSSIWQLPILFVCENNNFAISTKSSDSIAIPKISELASVYGMKAKTINGNELVEVFQTTNEMKSYILEEGGPAFIQADTYRLAGHYIGDSESYRNKSDTKIEWENEPILLFEKWIKNNKPGLINKLPKIDAESKKTIEDASKFGVECSPPPLETVYEDVFNKTGFAWERREVNEKNFSAQSN
jgi:TPP-dependent pyruvate/acetoin dehydrogenase alpha subunit